MQTAAILLRGPQQIGFEALSLKAPDHGDVIVEISHSGISTGTEKLFWNGSMPPFPGMGYPLVPGYEAIGTVVERKGSTSLAIGQRVYVPGANCYDEAHGLFGAAARHVVSSAERLVPVDAGLKAEGALLALAATARHAIAGLDRDLPDLIVGHGVLGRLLARLTIVAGGPAPTVWEISPERRGDGLGYRVVHPDDDSKRDYQCIYDASGNLELLDELVGRLSKGGELVLAGFYPGRLSLSFPQAFMKEIRLRIAAEWTPDDLRAVRDLVDQAALSLDGLISHVARPEEAKAAYEQAFVDPACLKMILDWKDVA